MSVLEHIRGELGAFLSERKSLDEALASIRPLLASDPRNLDCFRAEIQALDARNPLPPALRAVFEAEIARALGQASRERPSRYPQDHSTGTGADSRFAGTATGSDAYPPQPGEPQVGQILKDRFEIQEVLGRGGMSVVFRALDRRRLEARDRHPHIALKLLNEGFKRHPQALMALHREASKAQSLKHPNIIDVYDFDRDEQGNYFISMELLSGATLSQTIRPLRQSGGMPFAQAWPLIEQMGQALAAAHALSPPIVHSDFKPGNVFLTDGGQIKIFDFGIARAARPLNDDRQETTQFDPRALGAMTPGYASPEMLANLEPDPRDDIYGLAVTAYELLSGQRPFGHKINALQALAERRQPPRIQSLTRRQWQGLARGLALTRDRRTPSVRQFLDDLRPRRSPPVWSLAVGAAALIALLAVGLTLLLSGGSEVPTPNPPPTGGSASQPAPAVPPALRTADGLTPDLVKTPPPSADTASLPDPPPPSATPSPPPPSVAPAPPAARLASEPRPSPFAPPDAASDRPGGQNPALTYWNLIQNSTNPAVFEGFIARFDDPVLEPLAHERLRALRAETGRPSTDRPSRPTGDPSGASPEPGSDAIARTIAPDHPPDRTPLVTTGERTTTPAPTIPDPPPDAAPRTATRTAVVPESAPVTTGPPPPEAPEDAETARQAAFARAAELPTHLIQQALKDLGYYAGVADGISGPGTRDAIARYQKGRGLPQTETLDAQATVALIRTAARAGHAASLNTLGLMTAQGIGVLRDEAEALRLFRRAAEAGDAYAAYNLGVIHRDGLGVERSQALARRYFEQARAGGHPEAEAALAGLGR